MPSRRPSRLSVRQRKQALDTEDLVVAGRRPGAANAIAGAGRRSQIGRGGGSVVKSLSLSMAARRSSRYPLRGTGRWRAVRLRVEDPHQHHRIILSLRATRAHRRAATGAARAIKAIAIFCTSKFDWTGRQYPRTICGPASFDASSA
jgi:hypothetical protein